jgi:hypothetical protein
MKVWYEMKYEVMFVDIKLMERLIKKMKESKKKMD